MTAEELLNNFKKITMWSRRGIRAPHKPLLVLLALGRISQRKPRLAPFSDVEKPLKELLIAFGPRRHSYHPEYPFWYLQSKNNSKIWEIENARELPLKKNNREPRIEALRKAGGGFVPDVFALLIESPALRDQAARGLLSGNFPSSMHEEILNAVGLKSCEIPPQDGESTNDFAASVFHAYGYRCALCGYKAVPEQGKSGLEAVHIKWPQAGGLESIRNGLCLCVMHRRAFDRGVFGITEAGTVIISEQARRSKGLDAWLVTYQDQPVAKPETCEWQPNPEFLAWHMREVFQGEGKRSSKRK